MTNLLLILLLLVGCAEDENPVADTTPNEVDIDWFLVKTPTLYSYCEEHSFQSQSDNYAIRSTNETGYYFYYTSSSQIDDNILIDLYQSSWPNENVGGVSIDGGILIFEYDEETFEFDLSDSNYESDYYNISFNYLTTNGSSAQNTPSHPVDRILLDNHTGLITLVGSNFNTIYTTSNIFVDTISPNELIDYR